MDRSANIRNDQTPSGCLNFFIRHASYHIARLKKREAIRSVKMLTPLRFPSCEYFDNHSRSSLNKQSLGFSIVDMSTQLAMEQLADFNCRLARPIPYKEMIGGAFDTNAIMPSR